MSSFKRRTTSKQNPQSRGTRILTGSTPVVVTSTGIPSLDDILGGGLPLTCTQVILAPDVHSAYGELVQKYFISQGLSSGHDVIVVDNEATSFVEECMWVPGAATTAQTPSPDDEDGESSRNDAEIKIAWRYEQMKQFQTTVSSTQTTHDYSSVFDLTCRIPKSTIDDAYSSGQLTRLNIAQDRANGAQFVQVLDTLVEKLGPEGPNLGGRNLTRICVPSLGSAQWGDSEPQEICYFLHTLRNIVRRHPNVCASVSLPAYMCAESWGGAGWIHKLGWLSDACISLSAFSGNPSLSAMFPAHHGFVQIHSLPMPLTLVPPSDKLSTLRGLTSSGENNLAFKSTRKRIIFETLHLDLDGGVGERRTTPAPASTVLSPVTHSNHAHDEMSMTSSGAAAVAIQVEQVQQSMAKATVEEQVSQESTSTEIKKVKQRKKVAFTSDKPDLFDF